MGLRGIGECVAAFGADGGRAAWVAAVWAEERIAAAARGEEGPDRRDAEREDEGPEGDDENVEPLSCRRGSASGGRRSSAHATDHEVAGQIDVLEGRLLLPEWPRIALDFDRPLPRLVCPRPNGCKPARPDPHAKQFVIQERHFPPRASHPRHHQHRRQHDATPRRCASEGSATRWTWLGHGSVFPHSVQTGDEPRG